MICGGTCRDKSPTESATATHLVFPYRGVFVRHVGSVATVAEANQLVFFNDSQEYEISHPVGGGDACLSISINHELLRELSPRACLFFPEERPAVLNDGLRKHWEESRN